MEKGFFTMDDVNHIKGLNIGEAKLYVAGILCEHMRNHPNTRWANINKAEKIVNTARSTTELMFSLTNFILAHPSEGLKVTK